MDLEVFVFSPLGNSGKIAPCENTDSSMMPIGFPVSVPPPPLQGSSATPRPASSVLRGGGKNSVRRLRDGSPNLLRPQGPPGPGSLLRGHAGVPGDPDPEGVVPTVRKGEAGEGGGSLR